MSGRSGSKPSAPGGQGVADRRTYAEGQTVFRQGEQGDAAYLVEVGKVRVIQQIDGEEVVLADLGPGCIFGEMAVLDPGPRMASVRVVEGAVLLRIPPNVFEDRMKGMDRFMRGVVRLLISHLRNVHKVLQPRGGGGGNGGTAEAPAENSSGAVSLDEGMNAILRNTKAIVDSVDPRSMSVEVAERLGELEEAVANLKAAVDVQERRQSPRG